MHDVYKNTVCNILASRVAAEDSGFISDHRLLDPTPLSLDFNLQFPNTKLHVLEYDRSNKQYMVLKDPWTELERGPIYQRAWVLQEQLLAPRALHFGDDQVFWECKSTSANETWPFGWFNTNFEYRLRHFIKNYVWQFKVNVEHGDHNSSYRTWTIIVGDFTKRSLTFPSDCLPALSGIANEFAIHLQDVYFSGLWNKDFHRGILFMQRGNEITINEPDWEEFPSWSWAALHERVVWNTLLYDNDCYHLCEINLNHHEKTIHLRLRGIPMLLPSAYKKLYIFGTKEIQGYVTDGTDPCGFNLNVIPDRWFFWKFSKDSFKQDGGDLESIRARYRRAPGFQADACLKDIVLMPILRLKYPSYEDSPEFPFTIMIQCLLLLPHSNGQHGIYRRVGTTNMAKQSHNEMDFEAMKAQLWPDQKPLSSKLFQEEHEDGTYTITIV